MTEYAECTSCGGWCCGRIKRIAFRYLDRWRIAQEFGMTILEVTEQFATKAKWNKEDKYEGYQLKFAGPCRFWSQGRCGIHHIKPGACSCWEPGEHYKRACSDRELWFSDKYFRF